MKINRGQISSVLLLICVNNVLHHMTLLQLFSFLGIGKSAYSDFKEKYKMLFTVILQLSQLIQEKQPI